MRYRPAGTAILIATGLTAAVRPPAALVRGEWDAGRAVACARAGGEARSCSVAGSIPYWAQDAAFQSFHDHRAAIDTLSMFWYHLSPEGEVLSYKGAKIDRALIDHAHEHGVKVLALVANLPDDEREGDGLTWDPDRVRRVIRFERNREKHIAELVELTRRMGFDGIHIDYEALPAHYRGEFSLFVQQLGAALHEEGKLLAVALHAKTSEDDPSENNGSWAQDWAALHEHVDQLHYMTYSQHTAGTGPGPAAASGWVRRVLRYAVEDVGVPRSKIYMGLPLYAQEWKRLGSGEYRAVDEDLTFADVKERRREHDGRQVWSNESDTPRFVYQDHDGRKRVLWFENKRSSAEKLEVARALGVCNVALWRLGHEDPSFWRLLRRRIGRGREGGASAGAR